MRHCSTRIFYQCIRSVTIDDTRSGVIMASISYYSFNGTYWNSVSVSSDLTSNELFSAEDHRVEATHCTCRREGRIIPGSECSWGVSVQAYTAQSSNHDRNCPILQHENHIDYCISLFEVFFTNYAVGLRIKHFRDGEGGCMKQFFKKTTLNTLRNS